MAWGSQSRYWSGIFLKVWTKYDFSGLLLTLVRHAKRKIINAEDVKMVCRRNAGLQEVIDDYLKKILEK